MQIRSTWITGSSAARGKKGNRVVSLALTVTASLLLLTAPGFSAQKPATQSTKATTAGAGPASSVGVWTAPLNVGVVAIHSALLNTGKVLMWYYPSSVGANPPAVVFDPTTNTTTSVNIPSSNDFFCAGLTIGP